MTKATMASFTTQQVKVAEATSSVETARMLLHGLADEVMDILRAERRLLRCSL